MGTDWQVLAETLRLKQDSDSAHSWAERRAFLKSVGIDSKKARKNRLRQKDGLSVDAWWAAVGAVMRSKSFGSRKPFQSNTGQFPEPTSAGDITVETLVGAYASDARIR